ncbi:hypothetical protein L5515_009610 [Caenorhabditis briggsae]|uniref:Peptidase A1 domain-containing protein n=1 Tax=Caenorhabditis briggsae TaxID=6238 RepID=A0AAE9F969_CAEBR|nr:hypothetical protein L5515_009610 [Caenorhabditis briggsae]
MSSKLDEDCRFSSVTRIFVTEWNQIQSILSSLNSGFNDFRREISIWIMIEARTRNIVQLLICQWMFSSKFVKNWEKIIKKTIDSSSATCAKISIKSKSDTIIVKFDDEEIEYTDGNRAISDLTSILAYPDLKFHKFEVNSNLDKRFLERLVLKLESLKFKIHVAYFHLNSDNWEYHKRLLPFYRAETVGTVSIYGSQAWISEFVEEICEMKSTNMFFSNMELNFRSRNVKEATKIIKNLLQFSKLEYCYLDVDLRSNVQLKKSIERLGARIQVFPLAVDKVVPPMQNVLPQLDAPLFTVWLDRKLTISQGGSGGLFTYGAVDTTNCDSQITYVPLTAKTYWQFALDGFSVGTFSENKKDQVSS